MRKAEKPEKLHIILIAGTAALLIVFQLWGLFPNITTPIERLEYAMQDSFVRLRGAEEVSGEIVIVAIDDASFQWTGLRWPWPRSYHAEIVEQINKGGGKVIGVDLYLTEPDASQPENDAIFAKALSEAPAAVSVLQISKIEGQGFESESMAQPMADYNEVFSSLGTTEVKRDEDAIVRNVWAYNTFQGKVYPHWAFEIAHLYLGVDAVDFRSSPVAFNGKEIELNGSLLPIYYAGPAGTYPTYSAADVHDGITLEQNPDAFRDKIVLIGATSIALQDIYPTPFSATNPTPGVEIVANVIDTIINAKFMRHAPPWVSLLIILAAAGVAYTITRTKRPSLIVILLGAGIAIYLGVTFFLFASEHYIMPTVAPALMLFLGVILPTLEQAVTQEQEKRRVRGLFSRFISPEMVNQIMQTQDLNSLNKRAELTIIFTDIRGFTTLSEKLTPEGVVALLNPYLEAMSQVIHKHGGTVDKYEGDAIVAFFGEPLPFKDHAIRALNASLDMRKSLAELKEKWASEGRPSQIEMGVGVNTGEVFVGMLGSEQRINYTVIGDNANLAARLQDLTKAYAWPILISESTYQAVKNEFETELADSVVVKGKTKPVNVYKVICRKGTPPSEHIQAWTSDQIKPSHES